MTCEQRPALVFRVGEQLEGFDDLTQLGSNAGHAGLSVRRVSGLHSELSCPLELIHHRPEPGIGGFDQRHAIVSVALRLGIAGQARPVEKHGVHGGNVVRGEVDAFPRRQVVLGNIELAKALVHPPDCLVHHDSVCDTHGHQRYLPTIPVRLISTSSASSTAVITRAAASYIR